jgi:hypothetical protein
MPTRSLQKNRCDKLPNLRRRRGTNAGESTNKQVNAVAYKVSRQRPELSDAKVLLRVSRLNRDKDESLAHVTGDHAKPPFWYVLEAIDESASTTAFLKSTTRGFPYPQKEVPDEPIGLEFMRYTHWDIVEQNLYCQEASLSPQARDDSCLLPSEDSNASLFLDPQPSGLSSGASTWNRKEGPPSTRTAPHRQYLREPLTPLQEELFVQILVKLQQTVPLSIRSVSAFTNNLVREWNEIQMRSLIMTGSGYGGLMPLDIAKSRIQKLADNASCDHLSPPTQQNISLFLPPMIIAKSPGLVGNSSSMPQQLPILPRTTNVVPLPPNTDSQRKKAAKPEANEAPLKPLRELTEDDFESTDRKIRLTRSKLRQYASLYGLRIPRDLVELKKIVKTYWKDRQNKSF